MYFLVSWFWSQRCLLEVNTFNTVYGMALQFFDFEFYHMISEPIFVYYLMLQCMNECYCHFTYTSLVGPLAAVPETNE